MFIYLVLPFIIGIPLGIITVVIYSGMMRYDEKNAAEVSVLLERDIKGVKTRNSGFSINSYGRLLPHYSFKDITVGKRVAFNIKFKNGKTVCRICREGGRYYNMLIKKVKLKERKI